MINDQSKETFDFQKDLAVDRLKRVDSYAFSPEVDVAIAQDVLNKKATVTHLQGLLLETTDYSHDGDSISSWIYRLGGIESLHAALATLPGENSGRETIVNIARHLDPENTWIIDLAKKEMNINALRLVLDSAIERKIPEAIDMIESKLPELEKGVDQGSFGFAAFSWLEPTIENYRLQESFKAGQKVQDGESKIVPPFMADTRYLEIDEKIKRGEISKEEVKIQSELVSKKRSQELRGVVLDAIAKGDPNILQYYLRQSGYSGDILSDQLHYTLGEITIIQMGIDFMEKRNLHQPEQKPVYEIIDLEEAEEQFEKEAAKNMESVKEIDGVKYSMNVAPTCERAYWLTMRLGELKDMDMLKKIVDHPYASIGVRKEAIRQLLLAGEINFLKGYSLKANKPVNFWDTKIKLDMTSDNPSLDENTEMVERIMKDLPSYVSAILGQI